VLHQHQYSIIKFDTPEREKKFRKKLILLLGLFESYASREEVQKNVLQQSLS